MSKVTTEQKKSQGFTLIELLITLAVLAIVVTVGIPSMREAFEKRRTVAAVERLFSELQTAKFESIARSQPVFVNIVPGADWAIGISNNALCDPSDNNPACTLPDMDGNNPITRIISANDFGTVTLGSTGNQITFLPQRGTATANTFSVTSTGNLGFAANIVVMPLGQMRICSQDDNPQSYLTAYRDCG